MADDDSKWASATIEEKLEISTCPASSSASWTPRHRPATRALDPIDPEIAERVPMDAGYVNEILDPGSSEEVSVAYYRTAAARARRLQAEATTPRLKQYLRELIARYERLEGEIVSAAEKY